MKTIKTETWLPVFPGFYCTIFDAVGGVEEYVMETDLQYKGIDYDSVEWDYKEYFARVSKAIAAAVCRELIEGGFISGYQYDGLYSPAYYNFDNDHIHITVKISPESRAKIKAYLKENKKQWKQYIKERFTSCPGFYSYHSNDSKHEDWKLSIALQHKTRCGFVLDFIMQNEGYTTEDLYYSDEVSQEIQEIEYTIKETA